MVSFFRAPNPKILLTFHRNNAILLSQIQNIPNYISTIHYQIHSSKHNYKFQNSLLLEIGKSHIIKV